MDEKELERINKVIGLRNLKRMAREKLISFPPREEDIRNLKFLLKFWGKQFWLKRQMSKMNRKDRENIINTSGLTKIESYIYSRYLNSIQSGKRVSVERLMTELHRNYGVKLDTKLKETILRIRKKVRNDLYRKKLNSSMKT